MGAKIHEYPLERFAFGDEDYYDIDYYDGLIYQTAKIKGSTIKAGIIAGLPSVDTIYNADGTINSDRTITGTNSNQLLFDQFRKFVFNTNPAPFGTPGFEINGGITGPFLRVNNATTGDTMLQVSTAGITINEAYTLPLNDGSAGQVVTTDGAGNTSWETPTNGNIQLAWTTGLVNLTNGIDNQLPFDANVFTGGATLTASNLSTVNASVEFLKTGVYMVNVRGHLFDLGNGNTLSTTLYTSNDGITWSFNTIIALKRYEGPQTNQIQNSTFLINVTSLPFYIQPRLNPSGNTPFPADLGAPTTFSVTRVGDI